MLSIMRSKTNVLSKTCFLSLKQGWKCLALENRICTDVDSSEKKIQKEYEALVENYDGKPFQDLPVKTLVKIIIREFAEIKILNKSCEATLAQRTEKLNCALVELETLRKQRRLLVQGQIIMKILIEKKLLKHRQTNSKKWVKIPIDTRNKIDRILRESDETACPIVDRRDPNISGNDSLV
ncbi:uncharacterized protein LOC135845754 [Planococcus citri]|uniref:uncharacterized protein LOC135845754 n=1 Tax=Planococcus citri TaxID=170843 RepID=UPI0031F9A401